MRNSVSVVLYYIDQIMKSTQHVIKNAHRPIQTKWHIQYMYHLYMGWKEVKYEINCSAPYRVLRGGAKLKQSSLLLDIKQSNRWQDCNSHWAFFQNCEIQSYMVRGYNIRLGSYDSILKWIRGSGVRTGL